MSALLARVRALPRTETIVLVLATLTITFLTIATQDAQKPAPLASYSSYDADSGGTRALYELLQREQLRVDRFEQQIVFLDKSVGTLVWIEPLDFDPAQRTPTSAETAALEAWVKAGGDLLYAGHDAEAARQGFLKLPASTDRAIANAKPFVDPALRAEGITSVDDTSARRWIVKPGKRVLVADARGPLVLRYAYGKGTITTVVDEDILSNDGIGKSDRARLAYALAALRPSGPIAFEEETHGHFVPEHWWQIAPRPLVIAIALAVFALAVATVGAAIRLGPPLVPAVRDDASTSDFIGALAGLLDQGRAQRDAMLSAAESTTHALARSFGLGDRAGVEDVAARIEREDLRREYATMLSVTSNGYADDANLVRGVALAQHLRKELAAHVDRRR